MVITCPLLFLAAVLSTAVITSALRASPNAPTPPALAARQHFARKRIDQITSHDRRLRVHLISDLHTDYKENLLWVSALPRRRNVPQQCNVVIVAGDISSNHFSTLRETLEALREAYDHVIFVCGNHDLWTTTHVKERTGGAEQAPAQCSIQKLLEVMRVCDDVGVHTGPVQFGRSESQQPMLCIFPLQSWYSSAWDKEPDLPPELQHRNGDFLRRWADFRRCDWTDICAAEDFVSTTSNSTEISEWMALLNDSLLEKWSELLTPTSHILSVSHFLPRQELCPEKWALVEPNLPKVVGSDALERQVRQLYSALPPDSKHLHAFGHTHIPYDLELEGIRYVSWPLGSLAEQSRQCRTVKETGPILVYDDHKGGFAPTIPTLWGAYYKRNERNPLLCEVPRWAMRRNRGRKGSKEKVSESLQRAKTSLPPPLSELEARVMGNVPASVTSESWRLEES